MKIHWGFNAVTLLALMGAAGAPLNVRADAVAETAWVVFDPSPKPPPKGKWCFTRTIVSEDADHNISTQDVEICCAKDQLPTSNTDPKKQSCVAWTPAPGRDLCSDQQLKDGEFELCATADKSWLACCPDGFVPKCESANDPNLPRCVRPEKLPTVDGVATPSVSTDALLDELNGSVDNIAQFAPTETQQLSEEYAYAALLVSELEQSSTDYQSFFIQANRGDIPLRDSVEINLDTDIDLSEVSRVKGNSIEGCWDRVKKLIRIKLELGGSVLPHQAAAAAACCSASSERVYYMNIPMFCAMVYGNDLTLQGYKSCVEYGIAPNTADQCIFGISGYPRIGAFIKAINPAKAPIQIGR